MTLLLFHGTVQSQTLIPEAKKLRWAFEKLVSDPASEANQADYVAAFPSNTKTFLDVFSPKQFDQLYENSHKYMEALEQCGKLFPEVVVDKCINIGKHLVWDADAVGYLQKLSVRLASNNPRIFADKYKGLKISEQDSLINFYADVENHSAFKTYQELIDVLNSSGQTEISSKLEAARSKRKRGNDH